MLDDGSRDATAAVAGQAGALVTAVEDEGGLGAAVRQGLALGCRLGASAVVFMDADGEYDPGELAQVVLSSTVKRTTSSAPGSPVASR